MNKDVFSSARQLRGDYYQQLNLGNRQKKYFKALLFTKRSFVGLFSGFITLFLLGAVASML